MSQRICVHIPLRFFVFCHMSQRICLLLAIHIKNGGAEAPLTKNSLTNQRRQLASPLLRISFLIV